MRCTDQLISYHVEVPVDWYRDDLLCMCVWAPLLRRVTTSEKMLTLKLMLFVIYFGTWKMSKLIEHLKFENLSNEPLKKCVLEIYRCDECRRISRKTDAKSEQFGRSSSTIQARVCTNWDWSVTSMNAVFYIAERIHCPTNSPFCCWSWVNPFLLRTNFRSFWIRCIYTRFVGGEEIVWMRNVDRKIISFTTNSSEEILKSIGVSLHPLRNPFSKSQSN